MIKAKYQKMYTEAFMKDMDFVILGDYFIGPFIDRKRAELAAANINNLYSQLSPKPRTKIVYEKMEFNHTWELVKQFELHNDLFYKSSSTPTYELMSIENIQNMLRNEYPVSLYRKVEKEIDWRNEVHNKFQSSGYHWSTPIGEVINDESDCFLELCRTALRVTGELE